MRAYDTSQDPCRLSLIRDVGVVLSTSWSMQPLAHARAVGRHAGNANFLVH